MAHTKQPEGQILFEFLHKYVAMIVGYESLAKSKDLQLEVRNSIEHLGKQVVVHWKDIAHKLVEDRYICYFHSPSTWWQHLKQEHAPKWFVSRYPVKKTQYKRTVTFTRYATYPLANVKIEKPSRFFVETLGGVERIEDQVVEAE